MKKAEKISIDIAKNSELIQQYTGVIRKIIEDAGINSWKSYSIMDVCDLMGFSPRTLKRYRDDYKIIGLEAYGRVVFPNLDLFAFCVRKLNEEVVKSGEILDSMIFD